jgi:uncharacterized protein YceH (UPF0502 family)
MPLPLAGSAMPSTPVSDLENRVRALETEVADLREKLAALTAARV